MVYKKNNVAWRDDTMVKSTVCSEDPGSVATNHMVAQNCL